jgi:hypothetical protein
MRQRLSVYVLVVAAATALLGVPTASAGGVSPRAFHGADWKAHLTGSRAYPSVRGVARLDVTIPEDQRTLYVHIRDAGKLVGWSLKVYVAGQLAGGDMRVGTDGTARLYLSTNKGQVVPNVRLGHYSVRLRTRRGHLVASGKLRLLNPPG